LEEVDHTRAAGTLYRLSLYDNGKIFTVSATVIRHSGRLVAFRFQGIDHGTSVNLQTKLIRMEVEWIRLKALL